jgi:meiotically up-regulated gene 157 (Mug157) protein
MKITEFMADKLEEACSRINDAKIETVYRNCFKSTWETTMSFEEDGTTFIITGDIEAMWLRDSSLQVMPYLRLTEDPVVTRMFRGLIEKQASQILMDPYANAFNKNGDWSCYSKDHTDMGPFIWERKYEVDSLAFPLYLLARYVEATGDYSVFTETVIAAVDSILNVWTLEQDHMKNSSYRFERDSDPSTETLQNNGKGTDVAVTGMTWSGFRPSDDACTYHYLVPSNMLAVCVLNKLRGLNISGIDNEKAAALANQIKEGIYKYGIVEHEEFDRIFAYEVDGLGHFNLMDDANLPSLLSAPYFGFCEKGDPVYQNTRKFILSSSNPYFYSGKYAQGIGSPHTPQDYIWHISIAMQGLTASTEEEKQRMLQLLTETTAGTSYMHEGFDVNDPSRYTRPWFAWANSMFCLLAEDCYQIV